MASKKQWLEIEAEYIAGIIPVRQIAKEYGLSDTAILKRAKQYGWIRNPAIAKAKAVAERLAVNPQTAEEKAKTIISDAVDADVADMNRGLSCARKLLASIEERIDYAQDSRDLKLLSETVKINVDTIRRIRGLDDKDSAQDEFTRWSEAQLEAEIERLQS